MKAIRSTRLSALALAASLTAAHAGESAAPTAETLQSGDPCLFFRSQAYSRGIDDFTTRMLAACEVIARRRAAGVPLGDRLAATELMLDTYRSAVIAAGEDPKRVQHGNAHQWSLALSHAEKHAIADETGALLALEAIRTRF